MKSKNLLALGIFSLSTAAVVAYGTLPYNTSFSPEEGYFAGSAPGQGWLVRPQTTLVATEHYVRDGQSVLLYHGRPPGFLQRGFAPNGSRIVFVDLFVRPTAAEAVDDSTRIYFDSVGVAFVQQQDGVTIAMTDVSEDRRIQWRDLAYPVTTDTLNRGTEWIRVTLRLDYSRRNGRTHYDIYIDSELAEHDLAFEPRRFGSGRTLSISGALGAESWVDYIYAGADNPMFEDHGTGIPEEWLFAQGYPADRDVRYMPFDDEQVVVEAYLSEIRPDFADSGARGEILEEGRQLTDRRLTVFTRLERQDPELQQILLNVQELSNDSGNNTNNETD